MSLSAGGGAGLGWVPTPILDDCPYDGQPDEGTDPTMTVDQAEGPLAGLLVADFSRILAVPEEEER